MKQASRSVTSNQDGIHKNLAMCVSRHLKTPFQKPVAQHTQDAFHKVLEKLEGLSRPLVFDSCCGVGVSSRRLAVLYPDHWVIGVDKSARRLSREQKTTDADPDNLILVRADLNDFYRLMSGAGWQLARHYILYPNPWPKAQHLNRRWHGSPVFRDIVALGGRLELRSNWKLYLEEFQAALAIAGRGSNLIQFEPGDSYLTPFEKKYHESQQSLWQLLAE